MKVFVFLSVLAAIAGFACSASQPGHKVAVKGVQCDICELVVKVVEQYAVENSTEAEVKQELEEFCQSLPSVVSGTCSDLVNEYFDEIWNLIISDEDPETVCTQLGLCGSKKFIKVAPKMPPKEVDKVGGVQCDICEIVVKVVEQYAVENSTEAEVKQALEEFCQSLPSAVSGTCSDIVDEYFDEIWNLIINDEDPTTVCTQIGLCGSKKIKVAPKMPPKEVDKVGGVQCDICELVVKVVEQYAVENSTEAEVKQALEEFCQSLPSAVSGTCSDLVDEYFDEIWDLIINEEDPETVCTQLGLCGSKKIKVAPKQTVCDICKLVATFAATFIDENSTEEEAEQVIMLVCDLLPSDYSSECSSLVNDYFPIIYELLKSEVDNDQICYLLKLCTDSLPVENEAEVTSPSQDMQSNVTCELCESIVNFVKPFVDSKKDEDEVKKALQAFCSLIPISNTSAECLHYVDEYFTVIWTLVKAEVDSGEICELLELCKNGTDVQTVQRSGTHVEDSEAGILCALCEYVMKEIEAQLPLNATEDEIIKVVMDICNALPNTIKSQCTDFINEYGKEIINALINDVGPNAVCTIIHMCAVETVEDTRVVGGSKCSWGPAYWCSTPEAAIECNAKDYCSRQKLL